MKILKAILFAVLLVNGTFLFAQDAKNINDDEKEFDPNIFVGKYLVDNKECSSFEGSRVYINVGKDTGTPSGVDALILRIYGEDAEIVSILFGKGERRAPGSTDPNARMSWESTWNYDELRFTTSETYPISADVIIERSYSLSLNSENGRLIYNYDNDSGGSDSCELVPALYTNQAKVACEHILTDLETKGLKTLEKKEFIKKCRQLKNFTVTANNSGDWVVEFKAKATDLVVDESLKNKALMCEFNLDKPIGRFAPALENCDWSK